VLSCASSSSHPIVSLPFQIVRPVKYQLIADLYSSSKMGIEETEKGSPAVRTDSESPPSEVASQELINASGHVQELERNFSLLSMSAIAITTGNTWIAVGGTIVCF